MSGESRYYEIGKDRGRDGKSTPLGIFNVANKEEERAAQRGWEAGQSAREHAEALEEALEAVREEDSDTDYDSSDSYTSSSRNASDSTRSPSTVGRGGDATEGFAVFFVLGIYILMALFWGLVGWGVGGTILCAAGAAFGPVDSKAIFSFSTIFGIIGIALVVRKYFKDMSGDWERIGKDVGALFKSIAIVILVIIGLGIGFLVLGLIVSRGFSSR